MSEKVSKKWKKFKKEFVKTFPGVDERVADYIAVKEILEDFLHGYSTKTISLKFDISPKYVNSVVEEFFNFSPIEISHDFSPYKLFQNPEISKERFVTILNKSGVQDPIKWYDACLIYEGIKEEVEDFYEKY